MDEMSVDLPVKIWRYMDLAKFISLLSNEALYFSCPNKFADPFEGYLPKSHIKAMSALNQKFINEQLLFRDQIIASHPDKDSRDFDDRFYRGIKQYEKRIKGSLSEVSLKFGVCCWHRNENESEAMWRLYQSYGIAIESTVEQLKIAMSGTKNIIIENVRYVDFENAPIEKGHKHYGLFLKRKSFEYEQELRATILLKEPTKGEFVKCDMNALINHVHISPFAEPYLKEVVENILGGNLCKLNKPVIKSSLFDPPNYAMSIIY